MSKTVKLPALPNTESKHFPKGIVYINNKDNALQKKRENFDSCTLTCELQHDQPGRKLNVMEETLALMKKYRHLTK